VTTGHRGCGFCAALCNRFFATFFLFDQRFHSILLAPCSYFTTTFVFFPAHNRETGNFDLSFRVWLTLFQDFNIFKPRIFQGFQRLIRARKGIFAYHAQAGAYPVWLHNEHIFGLIRESPRGRLLILGNFSDAPQVAPAYRLLEMGFGGQLVNLVDGQIIPGWQDLRIEPYGFYWLSAEQNL
jgi:hypothetical protein